MKFPNRIAKVRQEIGLSREALAQSAGVTRQAIGLIEAGKVSPSAIVAMRIAKALLTSVEELFADPAEDSLVDTVPPSGSATVADSDALRSFVGMVDGRMLARPVDSTSLSSALHPAHAVVHPISSRASKGRLEWLSGRSSSEGVVFISGCDAGLGLMAEHVAKQARGHEGVWFEVPNAAALRELELGYTHVAAIHRIDPMTRSNGTSEIDAADTSRYLQITFAEAEVGWMVRKGDRLRFAGPESLQSGRLRVVNRPQGAGVRRLFDELLGSVQVSPSQVTGYDIELKGHVAVAEAVAQGLADVGLGHAGAAALFGLDFIPVQRERCTLVIPKGYLKHTGVQALLETLQTDSFRRELECLGPYDVNQTGNTLA
ncbi:substrate-binding domain-containing protein [Alicyclobacillus ferrooxydans]|uniref:substrate-binding domain-containing protein n=1 Tax=Alicyclobacillus ferrooxydans TaxID=471514 RepID=UPI0006D52F2A|nr:substrate-binding domain-containing protein [Alicyclobacillus ferrooxydans]